MVLREHIGLSQREMAARLGLTTRTYKAWEHSRRKRHSYYSMVKISEATGVSLDWLGAGGYPGQAKSDQPFASGGGPLPPGGRPTRITGQITPEVRAANTELIPRYLRELGMESVSPAA